MNKFYSQETIGKFIEEESADIEFMLQHRIRNGKTSDTEKILTTLEKKGFLESGYSYEAKTIPSISVNEIKRLNREITRRIPPEQIEKLFIEHSNLVKKKFKEGISEREEKRLKLIRWELDRVEDALHGDNIDRFESFLESYERFAKDINEFVDNIRYSKKNRGQKR